VERSSDDSDVDEDLLEEVKVVESEEVELSERVSSSLGGFEKEASVAEEAQRCKVKEWERCNSADDVEAEEEKIMPGAR